MRVFVCFVSNSLPSCGERQADDADGGCPSSARVVYCTNGLHFLPISVCKRSLFTCWNITKKSAMQFCKDGDRCFTLKNCDENFYKLPKD